MKALLRLYLKLLTAAIGLFVYGLLWWVAGVLCSEGDFLTILGVLMILMLVTAGGLGIYLFVSAVRSWDRDGPFKPWILQDPKERNRY